MYIPQQNYKIVERNVIKHCIKYFFLYSVRSTGNGNCLYNSCSILICGCDKLSTTLRVAVSCELLLHPEYYANHPYISQKAVVNNKHHPNFIFALTISNDSTANLSDDASRKFCIEQEGIKNIRIGSWSSFMCMLGLSSVINCKLESVYPLQNNVISAVLNGIIHPRSSEKQRSNILSILWSRCGGNSKNTTPNHFVPLIKTAGFEKMSLKNSLTNKKDNSSKTLFKSNKRKAEVTIASTNSGKKNLVHSLSLFEQVLGCLSFVSDYVIAQNFGVILILRYFSSIIAFHGILILRFNPYTRICFIKF